MRHQILAKRLERGIFLSSMMGITTGRWAAEHGRGAAMVQIGALIADLQDRSHAVRYLLPEEQADMVAVLRDEVQPIRRALPGVPVCLNAAPGDLESALRMARAFHEAGGDIFELNCHGGYGKLLDRGLLRAMAHAENRATMREWLQALCALSVPVVVKFNGADRDVDFAEVLDAISGIPDLLGVHFNVRDDRAGAPDLELVRRVRPGVKGMLWCSGHVRERRHAAELFEAGADCVGIAQAVREEPGIIARVAAFE